MLFFSWLFSTRPFLVCFLHQCTGRLLNFNTSFASIIMLLTINFLRFVRQTKDPCNTTIRIYELDIIQFRLPDILWLNFNHVKELLVTYYAKDSMLYGIWYLYHSKFFTKMITYGNFWSWPTVCYVLEENKHLIC